MWLEIPSLCHFALFQMACVLHISSIPVVNVKMERAGWWTHTFCHSTAFVSLLLIMAVMEELKEVGGLSGTWNLAFIS
jgi:hypothetical protein